MIGSKISEVRRYPDDGRVIIALADGTRVHHNCAEVEYRGVVVGRVVTGARQTEGGGLVISVEGGGEVEFR